MAKEVSTMRENSANICDALRDLVAFVQFKVHLDGTPQHKMTLFFVSFSVCRCEQLFLR